MVRINIWLIDSRRMPDFMGLSGLERMEDIGDWRSILKKSWRFAGAGSRRGYSGACVYEEVSGFCR